MLLSPTPHRCSVLSSGRACAGWARPAAPAPQPGGGRRRCALV